MAFDAFRVEGLTVCCTQLICCPFGISARCPEKSKFDDGIWQFQNPALVGITPLKDDGGRVACD